MAKPVLCFIVGTRPDAIKTAPVVQEFRKYPEVDSILVATGQHREMLHQALASFQLKPDYDLDIMQHGQSLADITRRVLEGLDELLVQLNPAYVFGQGDTSTTFVGGLAAFYRQIPFAHVEAGLRTDSIWEPYPEEFNRRAVGLFAKLHFPPTQWAADNLARENAPGSIYITGNTGIDAVRQMASQHHKEWYQDWPGRIILLTTHRRENWGAPQENIARACLELLQQFTDCRLVVAMHRNPQVRATLQSILGEHDRADLIEPPDYADFVKLMERSDLIITDSGGVQEEAPSFGKPVLVLRDVTERPEGVEAGTAKLIGTRYEAVLEEASTLLANSDAYLQMANAVSPYGDGKASERIRYATLQELGISSPEVKMWG